MDSQSNSYTCLTAGRYAIYFLHLSLDLPASLRYIYIECNLALFFFLVLYHLKLSINLLLNLLRKMLILIFKLWFY